MSRIGRMPVAIPAGVTVTIAENNLVTVRGWSYSSYQTERLKENEIFTRSDKNLN